MNPNNNRILKFYRNGEPLPVEYDTMIPDKIDVLKCRSYSDCTYVETVRLTFRLGTSDGMEPISETRQIVELDIETGYLPYSTVKKALSELLDNFRIYKVDNLIRAFEYRRFYCSY